MIEQAIDFVEQSQQVEALKVNVQNKIYGVQEMKTRLVEATREDIVANEILSEFIGFRQKAQLPFISADTVQEIRQQIADKMLLMCPQEVFDEDQHAPLIQTIDLAMQKAREVIEINAEIIEEMKESLAAQERLLSDSRSAFDEKILWLTDTFGRLTVEWNRFAVQIQTFDGNVEDSGIGSMSE